MSIDLTTQYPGKVGPATAAFPYGEPRNITAPSDGTGTPWEAAIVKDTEGFKQALLKSAGIVPSGTPDEVGASEYLQSVTEIAGGRAIRYTRTGTANALIATPLANQEGPASYFTGMVVRLTPGANNAAGAVTLNVNGLGLKNVYKPDGVTALDSIDLKNGVEVDLIYNGTAFVLDSPYPIICGREHFAAVAAGSEVATTFAHGFGTTDLVFGMTVGDDTAWNAASLNLTAQMVSDGGFVVYAGNAVMPTIVVGPTAGNMMIRVRNNNGSPHDIVVHWWCRRRSNG